MDEKFQVNNGKLSIVGMHSAKDLAEISSESLWDNEDNFFKIEENVSSDEEIIEEKCVKGTVQEKKSNEKETIAVNPTISGSSGTQTQIRFKLTPNTVPKPQVTQSQVFLKGKKDQVILHSSKSSIRGPVMINQTDGNQSFLQSTPVACHPNTNLLKSQVVCLNQSVPNPPILTKNICPVSTNVNSYFEGKPIQRTINSKTAPIFIPEKTVAQITQPCKTLTPLLLDNNVKSTAIGGNKMHTIQKSRKSLLIPPLQPKPGQILLQTADGQKLLLQPISGNLNSIKTKDSHELKQGVITPLSSHGKETCVQPSNNNFKTNLSKSNLVFGSKPHPEKIIFLPNPWPVSIPTSATSISPKQIDVSTSSLDKKSVLMNILKEDRKILRDSSISDNIEVLEVNNSNVAGEEIEWVEKCSKINQVPNRQTFKKKRNDEDVYFSKVSSNKKGGAEDVACFLPLQVCGTATLEHLISLTENKTIKATEENSISDREHSQTIFQDTPKQPCVSSLLKDTLKDFPTKHTSGGNRRKQILTNRTAEAEESFMKISKKFNYPPKKKRHPVNKPRAYTVESDEIISSISDFDLVEENFEANNSYPTVAVDKNFSNVVSIKPEPLSPECLTDSLSLKISDVCSLKIEDEGWDMALCSSSTNQSMKRNCDTLSHDNLVNIKRIKTEPETDIKIKKESEDIVEPLKVGQILSSDDLVRRSYRIFSKPSYQSGNISTAGVSCNPKEFIPISNVLNSKVELNKTKEEIDNNSLDNLSCDALTSADPEAPYDYSSHKGPISIMVTSISEKCVKKYMGLKSCYVKAMSDFNIIESRFAINGVRKVYSCNHCKGEYATVNVKSLAEHIEMHKKFPRLHMLVQERPYEVTAVSGKEISDMVSVSDVLPGNDFVASTDRNRNKKHFCMLCPYYARSPLTLKSHRNVHNLATKVTCDICEIVYRNSKVLEMHKTNEHKNELKKMVYISARPL